MLVAAVPAGSQQLVGRDQPGREELAQVCARPFAPDPPQYQTRAQYDRAREIYYREASVYVSDCIDRWIMQTRQRYEEMFLLEAEAYDRERRAVMDEMRAAGRNQF